MNLFLPEILSFSCQKLCSVIYMMVWSCPKGCMIQMGLIQFTQIAWNYLSCMCINHIYNIYLFRVFHETTSMIMASSFILIGCACFLQLHAWTYPWGNPALKFLLNCGETPINLSLEGWDCSSKDGVKVGLDCQFIPLAGFNHQLRSWR
jgi:hypothetical protein